MPASLLSINIRGVRSYSPHQHKAQNIEFMPLTLITGSNGSGKTTIIESLKFIISGEEPPLSDSRRNFLHTTKNPPSSFDKNTSYSSIQLEFQNSKNDVCIAKREITKLDAGKNTPPTISSSYKIGKKNWIHVHKQDDWNKTLPLLFNLPNQSILNNVILCHQEDNLWCMGDSSSVKQIFDRIFGCEQYKKEIRYIDAEIKASKSDLAISLKELQYLKDNVQQGKNLIDNLEKLKEKVGRFALETKDLDEQIIKSTESKESIRRDLIKIESLKQRELDLIEKERALRQLLTKPFIEQDDTSDLELKQKLQNHSEKVDSSKKRQSMMRNQQDALQKEIAQLESKKNSLQEEINRFRVMDLKSKETHETLVNKLHDINLANSDLADLGTCLEQLELLENKLLNDKCNQSELEDNLSSRQQKLSKSLSSLEGVYQGLLQKIKSKELYIKRLSGQLEEADPITRDLATITENFKKMSVISDEIAQSIDDHLLMQFNELAHLIRDSSDLLKNIATKIKKDSVAKIAAEIKQEKDDIENNKNELTIATSKKEALLVQQGELEAEHQKVRTASKEAHNKVVSFKSVRNNIMTTYECYQKERKFLETRDLRTKTDEFNQSDVQLSLKRSEIKLLSAGLVEISDEIVESFQIYQEIKTNIEIREVMNLLKEIRNEISNFGEDSIKLSELRAKLKDMEAKELKLRDKRSMIAGSKSEIDKDIQRIQTELKCHKRTNSKYSECLGKIVCNQIIMEDLAKLKECFQQSITDFHNQMIVKINEILRLRWRQIYKGSDVDLIELVDEEITKGKDKKAFNYYIAMKKQGVRMKMREKSSAGQKALASIVLRMTLAELFVKDFAFIALDEPTANLDFANVQSLARAIGFYVKKRLRNGFNIQWIIITHDVQFLEALDAESSPFYYRVQLDEEGCSKVVKKSCQDCTLDES